MSPAEQTDSLFELDAVLRQALLVERVAMDQMILQNLSSPLAELRGAFGTDSIANGYDGVEVLMLDGPSDLSRAFLAND